MTTPEPVILPGGRLAYTLPQLDEATPFSASTYRRAITKAKDDGAFPPPLKAKRDSKGRAVVIVTDVLAWFELLPDY